MGRDKSVNDLEKALNTFREDAWLVVALAAVLDYATQTGRVSYGEVMEIAGITPRKCCC